MEEFTKKMDVAHKDAKRIVKKMEDKNLVEDNYAKEALEFSVAVVRANAHTIKDRLQAAKLVLDFTKQKPSSKAEVTVKRAEDFLAELAEKDEDA